MHSITARAEATARRLLAALPQRLAHTVSVAGVAETVSATLDAADADVLVASAWLHDIGYAPDLEDTGMHAIDGARYLARQGWSSRVVNLVAHHSCSRFEAAERGIAVELSWFPCEEEQVTDALIYSDMAVGPTGARAAPVDRIAEILRRYPLGTPVHRAIAAARPDLLAACSRTTSRINGARVTGRELHSLLSE